MIWTWLRPYVPLAWYAMVALGMWQWSDGRHLTALYTLLVVLALVAISHATDRPVPASLREAAPRPQAAGDGREVGG